MKAEESRSGKKIVAIATSTGGPKALQVLVPLLPPNLNAPILIVQHMPEGFTKALADRLNMLSEVTVKEAEEGDVLENGHVFLARGGRHMNAVRTGERHRIHYTDEPPREGVKPCANYMYESLADCGYEEIVCAVLTGMGADGTAGIVNLKKKKRVTVFAQKEETCVVYGMPMEAFNCGAVEVQAPLYKIADIILNDLY